MPLLSAFLERLAERRAVVVQIVSTEGSVPREAGTWMAVFGADGPPHRTGLSAVIGTIGGGRLEFDAIAEARALLAQPAQALHSAIRRRYALGPSLGQCCGGVVVLRFDCVTSADAAALRPRLGPPRRPLALFGGGHVGTALVRVLAPLPFALTWIDSRDEIFPDDVPGDVACEHSDPVQAAVPALAAGSQVLAMSFSHAEDLDVIAACLSRQRARGDLPFIGLIGSRTKWTTFRRRLEARGFTPQELAWVTCPIGIPGIAGKEPDVIAVSVAAQLLLHQPAKG